MSTEYIHAYGNCKTEQHRALCQQTKKRKKRNPHIGTAIDIVLYIYKVKLQFGALSLIYFSEQNNCFMTVNVFDMAISGSVA